MLTTYIQLIAVIEKSTQVEIDLLKLLSTELEIGSKRMISV